MNKNEQFEVVIEDVGANGEGICHIDGITVFVPFAYYGEKCKIHILKVKGNIAFAKVIQIIDPSEHRVRAKCPYFQKCGGCTLQHIRRDSELETKKKHIETCMRKYAGVESIHISMVDSDLEYGYRNKCAFPVRTIDGKATVCMFKSNSHNAIRIEKCELADELINKVLKVFNVWLERSAAVAFDELTNTGNIKFLVCRVLEKKALITIVINSKKLAAVDLFVEMLEKEGIDFGLNLNINTQNNNVILTSQFVHVAGFETLQGEENSILYPISSLSFMQVNDFIKTEIYNKTLSCIDSDSVVVDAYSGAGLMSAMIATRAKKVYGIEIIEAATRNADELARVNNIENLDNINGDCAVELPKLVQNLKGQSVKIVLDPPRKGCDKRVLGAVVDACPSGIIYISCNPATLARDSKIILDAGYIIQDVTGFNMFPQTSHVETVVVFEKGK